MHRLKLKRARVASRGHRTLVSLPFQNTRGFYMSTHLTLLAKLKAKPGKEAALREALMAMVEPSRAESGCINYDLHVEQSDESILWVYENWVDTDALVAHTKEPHYLALGEKKDALLAAPVQLIKLNEISKPTQARVPAARK